MKLSSYGVNKLVKHIFLLKADAIDVIEIYIKIHEHYVTSVYIYFLCSIISRVSVGFCYERESAFKVEVSREVSLLPLKWISLSQTLSSQLSVPAQWGASMLWREASLVETTCSLAG